jgi:hypothetical protein
MPTIYDEVLQRIREAIDGAQYHVVVSGSAPDHIHGVRMTYGVAHAEYLLDGPITYTFKLYPIVTK